MAIEPLSSVMSFQAQGAPNYAKQEVSVTTEGNGTLTNVVEDVDVTTASVKAATKSDDEAGYQDGNEQNSPMTQTEQLKKAVDRINRNMSHSEVLYGIHEATDRVTIKIVDKETKEVIKELPPEKTLDMIAKAWELAGILVDEKR